MSSADLARRGDRTARLAAGAGYVAVMVTIAAIAAWPIYRSPRFVLLVVVAALLGAGIASLVLWRRWNGVAVAGLLAAAVLVVGVPLAVPGRLGSPSQLLHGVADLLAGTVVGWKDLLTVELPVGSYRNLLVPALIVFLAGTALALRWAWQVRAAPTVLAGTAMVAFGLLFGRPEVSAPLAWGPVVIAAPVETAVGIGALAAGVWWLGWHGRQQRRQALERAARAGGVRVRRSVGPRQAAAGAGMVALAALTVGLVVPAAAADLPRDVLRQGTGPQLDLLRAPSPLTAYRSFFADAVIDDLLFTAIAPDHVDRVRLAVLDSFDGAVFRTAAGDAVAPFVRVAAGRDPGPGERVAAEVRIGALTGLWMPSVGSVAEVETTGARAAALADGFYYNADLDAAVQTADWTSGDGYRLTAALPAPAALASASAPGGQDEAVAAPASLRQWMQTHTVGAGGTAAAGATLDHLVTTLRARGYLSHALDDGEGTRAWMSRLGDYRFVASASGHSLARIDEMFQSLLESEADPASSDGLVAAVGDDEQFAVAVALMARELGFPARVVVGTRLHATDPDLSVCPAGQCRSGDLAAWVEVRASDGTWIPVDVTPQHAVPPGREATVQPDPSIGTAVRPDAAADVVPPTPDQQDSPPGESPDGDAAWVWLGPVVRAVGIATAVLIVVTGPFLSVLGAKAWRRRTRRRTRGPAARIAAGWDEYTDAGRDAGRSPAASATRTETAALFATPSADELARAADEAVFSPRESTAAQAERFWDLVDADRTAFAVGRWQRVRAAVSPRSFLPARPASPPERRSRRPEQTGPRRSV